MALEPLEVATRGVEHQLRFVEAVLLARVDHQLGLDAETAQRLVELLALAERDAAVLGAVQDQGGRRGAGEVEERRVLEVDLRPLPGRTAEVSVRSGR